MTVVKGSARIDLGTLLVAASPLSPSAAEVDEVLQSGMDVVIGMRVANITRLSRCVLLLPLWGYTLPLIESYLRSAASLGINGYNYSS